MQNIHKIFVIEDNLADFVLLKEALELTDMEINDIKHAHNLNEFEHMIAVTEPDLVFLDLNLSTTRGLDTFLAVFEIIPEIPVIILSGQQDATLALDAIKAGAQDYLIKGEFDDKLLNKTIQYSVERKRSRQRLENERNLQKKMVLKANLEGQENERNQIGRELHDNINQMLASIKLLTGSYITNYKVNNQLLTQSLKITEDCIEEIRRLSSSLVSPKTNALGLKESTQGLCDILTSTQAIDISINIPGETVSRLSEQETLFLYRIIQEQLNNIMKHAKASNVWINMHEEDNKIVLAIKDNGQGFDITEKRHGIGLHNMQNRVEILNGEFIINTSPGNGCELKVILQETQNN